MKHLLHSFTTITRSQFEELTQAFVRVSSTQMRSNGWLTSASSRRELLLKGDPTLFHLVGEREISSLFVPFVRKKIVGGSCRPEPFDTVRGEEPRHSRRAKAGVSNPLNGPQDWLVSASIQTSKIPI